MKKFKYFLAILITLTICLSGCNSKSDGINKLKIGNATEDVHLFTGEDLNWKSNIYFKNQIKYVEVNFAAANEIGWSFEKIYNEELKGAINHDFDEIISLPPDLPVGNYVFTIKAVSQKGEVEIKKVKINIAVDSSRPFASKLDVGLNAKKNDLHLETHISAPKKVQDIKVTIKWDSLSKEFLFLGENITGELDFTFHEHLNVSKFPVGNYEVVLDVKDMNDKTAKTIGTFKK